VKKEAGYLRRELRRLTGLDNIIGQSPKMRAIFDLIQTIAPQSSRVLITGESGTGKELVARAIHENSARSQAPFITINCGAFPETLLESELFGYMKGSFTGPTKTAKGCSKLRTVARLFMDEIGNMSLTMQVRLYRVLQEGKVRPIGSTAETDVDVAYHRSDKQGFRKGDRRGRFREDLYYRLSVIPIQLPSLRERREDIPLLARYFLERFRKTMESPLRGFAGSHAEAGKSMTGPEMYANWKIHLNARWRWSPARDLLAGASGQSCRIQRFPGSRHPVARNQRLACYRFGFRERDCRRRETIFTSRFNEGQRGSNPGCRDPQDQLQVISTLR